MRRDRSFLSRLGGRFLPASGWLFLVGLVLALVFVAGCNSNTPTSTASSSSTATTAEENKAPSALHLTGADSGRSLEIQAGGTIDIALKANPSTGYFWELEDLDAEASLIEQVGDPTFVSDKPGTAGAGGILTFTFRAVDKGEMVIKLVYLPPSGDKPSKTFQIDLTVK